MTNREKYNQPFDTAFEIKEAQLFSLQYQNPDSIQKNIFPDIIIG